jgi:membrane peptidoglycan carboxypeptidase
VRILWRYFAIVVIAASGFAIAAMALVPAARSFATATKTNGSDADVTMAPLAQTSILYARDGSVLATFHKDQNRQLVSIDQVPDSVVDAVVDTEDAKFFEHGGIDPVAMGRAFFSNVDNGNVGQGGSTITQQLIKNTVLTSEKKVSRKIKEAVLSVRLEDQLTKRQILERYLNTIYFGDGAYGIEAASETYFGVSVQKVNVGQAAFMAGMIQDPSGYDPYRFPAKSRARRDFVADRMLKQGHLSPAQVSYIKKTQVPTVRIPEVQPNSSDAYFVEQVRQDLLDGVDGPSLGTTPQARSDALYKGGLRIYTTFDPKLQAMASQAMADNLPTQGGQWAGALVSVEPSTGAVRALIGGPGFDDPKIGNYDIATQGDGRQPGSSFKPIVLATALQMGYRPDSLIDGTSPCSVPNPGSGPYSPENDEGTTQGVMTLTNAMAFSVNCAYVRLGIAVDPGNSARPNETVSLNNVAAMAKTFGITTHIDVVPSESLGTNGVHPIDMAGVYATFANNGVHHTPYLIDRVVDDAGKVIFTGGDKGTVVLSPQKNAEEIQVLRSVVTVQGATGLAANLSDREVAGKTGTSDKNTNAWFDGFTPQLATVVWMGSPVGSNPDLPQFRMTSVGGRTASGVSLANRVVFGGTYPAMIWHEFMSNALRGQPAIPFPSPNPADLGTLTFVPSAGFTGVHAETPSFPSQPSGGAFVVPPLNGTPRLPPANQPTNGPQPPATRPSVSRPNGIPGQSGGGNSGQGNNGPQGNSGQTGQLTPADGAGVAPKQ